MTDQPVQDRNLLILSSSSRWHSAVIRSGMQWRISAALDVDDLLAEAFTLESAVGLIELHPENVSAVCNVLGSTQVPPSLLLVAAGDFTLTPWLPLVRGCGFSAVIQSLNQIGRLETIGNRHFEAAGTCSRRTLEEIIESRLPWRPVS